MCGSQRIGRRPDMSIFGIGKKRCDARRKKNHQSAAPVIVQQFFFFQKQQLPSISHQPPASSVLLLLPEAAITVFRFATTKSIMPRYSMSSLFLFLSAAASLKSSVVAFSPLPSNLPTSSAASALYGTKVGVFFGTSTGSTEEVAYLISEEFGPDIASEPIEIDGVADSVASEFAKYDALVVGTPTWNTAADSERSGTGWDEIYYSTMEELNIAGKKVAVFGLGDSVSYGENYADAAGELHDVFENLDCQMLGYTSQEGYLHEASKSIRGDKFCGLLCDQVNQEELSGPRVENWVDQLIGEGILEGGGAGGAASSDSAPVVVDVTAELEENSILMEESIAAHSSSGDAFEPHYNPRSGVTMWTSRDGKTCYYTKEAAKMSMSP